MNASSNYSNYCKYENEWKDEWFENCIKFKNMFDIPNNKFWCWVVYNKNIQMKNILNINKENKDFINWRDLSSNPSIGWDDIVRYPELPWDWRKLTSNPSISYSIIKQNKNKHYNWSKENILSKEDVFWDDILDLINFEDEFGDYSRLVSTNPNITWDIVQKNNWFKWDWDELSSHPNITWDIIKENPDCFNPSEVSKNPNITWDIIKDNFDYRWDWGNLSKHPNITWDIIKENPNDFSENSYIEWDWFSICENPNVTWKHIKNEKFAKTYNYNFAVNKNLSWDIVFNEFDKIYFIDQLIGWNLIYVLANDMENTKKQYISKRIILEETLLKDINKRKVFFFDKELLSNIMFRYI